MAPPVVREKSLLDRLRDPDSDRARSVEPSPARLAESVLANLRRLLNSRHGIAPAQAEYGIPDLSDLVHSFPEANSKLRAAVKAAIEKYEPRLRRVAVRQANDPDDILSLRLEVTAELVSDGPRTPL